MDFYHDDGNSLIIDAHFPGSLENILRYRRWPSFCKGLSSLNFHKLVKMDIIIKKNLVIDNDF